MVYELLQITGIHEYNGYRYSVDSQGNVTRVDTFGNPKVLAVNCTVSGSDSGERHCNKIELCGLVREVCR